MVFYILPRISSVLTTIVRALSATPMTCPPVATESQPDVSQVTCPQTTTTEHATGCYTNPKLLIPHIHD